MPGQGLRDRSGTGLARGAHSAVEGWSTVIGGRGARACLPGTQRRPGLTFQGDEVLIRAKLSKGFSRFFLGGESAQIGFLHILDAQQGFE